MKNRKFVWLLGTLALALSLVLAGCDSPLDKDEPPKGPYTVTFSTGEGSGTPPKSMTVENGKTITLPVQGDMIAPEGKTFQGWRSSYNSSTYQEGESVSIYQSTTFIAQWIDLLKVTFDKGEGGGTPPESISVGYSETITLPGQGDMTAPEGKTFQGWRSDTYIYINGSGKNEFSVGESITISENNIYHNITFTAIWIDDGMSMVTFDTGGGGGTPPESMIVEDSTSIILPGQGDMIAPEGKIFQGWRYSDFSSTYQEGESVSIYQSTTFTAQWKDLLKVTFDKGEGSGGTPPGIMFVEYGETITVPGQGDMTAPAGKIFQGWRSDNGSSTYQEGESVSIYRDTTFTAQWATKKYAQEGIYISLISFAGNASILNNYNNENFVFLNSDGKNTLSSILNSRYSKASASGTALFYGVHKALANLTANEGEFPTDISSVNLITFTDCLDNGSFGASNTNPIEDKTGVASTAYATYVHGEIGSRTINEKPITAYSVGVKGDDVEDEAQFTENLGNIASKPDNVHKINDFNQLEDVFSGIADGLSFASHFSMTSTQNDPGTIIRMTFDVTSTNSADAATSSKYIEGELAYSDKVWTLTNVTYGGGIASDALSGTTITGTTSGNNISFLFKNIKGYDPATDTVQQWTKSSAGSSAWQRNSEYSASGSTSTSTVLIQLVLDASTSLNNTQIGQIRTAVSNFIDNLYSRVYGGSN
jgi:hypothetical protein